MRLRKIFIIFLDICYIQRVPKIEISQKIWISRGKRFLMKYRGVKGTNVRLSSTIFINTSKTSLKTHSPLSSVFIPFKYKCSHDIYYMYSQKGPGERFEPSNTSWKKTLCKQIVQMIEQIISLKTGSMKKSKISKYFKY